MTTVSISSNDRTDMKDAFQAGLSELLGREVEISEPLLLAGGAPGWPVGAEGRCSSVRRRAVVSSMARSTMARTNEARW